MMVDFGAAKATDGFVRIGPTMKHEDAAAFGRLRRGDEIEGKKRAAVAFVAARPLVGPPMDLLHRIGHEGLFGVEDGEVLCAVHLKGKGLVDVV